MISYLPKYKIRWQDLTVYFYDNHWPATKSIYDWLELEYNAISSYTTDFVVFETLKDQTMFVLRWT